MFPGLKAMEGTMKNPVWILMLMATAGSAAAEEYWSSCNSCSEPQAQRVALREVEDAVTGRHDVYIVDFDRETVRRYVAWREYDREFRTWRNSLWPVATEAHVTQEFVQIVSAIKADVESLESGKVIPPDVVGSAYDLVHNSVNRQRVASYIFEHMSLWESIGAPVFVPLSLLRKVVDLNLTISVIFADGSTAQFVLTGVDGSLGDLRYVFELVDGSARDADGNVIPRNVVEAAPFEGRFRSERGAQRMIDFIRVRYVAPTNPDVQCSARYEGNDIIVTCRRP
jgi:hypothetical protein